MSRLLITRNLGPALAAVVCTVALVLLLAEPAGAAGRWRPQPTTAAWQWQLQGKIDTSIEAGVYEVDGFETPAKTVARLHRLGRRAVCYLDVGSWESYRPDAKRFPKAVLGHAYSGYPDERWLDIRRIGVLAPILRKRFDLCRRKGFDAVEPDNVAGYENESGFPLSADDQLRFNRWAAREVHRRGMSVALKNDPEQVRELVGNFDFAVVEQCFAYEECGMFVPFVVAGKAVFVAEYEEPPATICPQAERLRFSVIRKDPELFARPWEPCVP
ncbi:MAG TPA: endo alpha-1,4 polygalactosaminidase [Solirubrobacterales bacterium]